MGRIIYRIDVMGALKATGWSTYKLRDGSVLGQAIQQKLRHGEPVNFANLAKLCEMLHCQPGDLLEYTEQ